VKVTDSAGLDVDRLRADTPGCENRVHFNNAGAGLMPQTVLDAMLDHLRLEAEIGGYEAAEEQTDAIADFYAATATLLDCRPENIAFTPSATDAYARALSSIPFAAGDVILTTRDDYVSNQLAFISLRERFGVEVIHAPVLPEGGVDVEAMGSLMRSRKPRLVAVTHIPTNSGLVQPVAEIGRHCRELELLYLVDACQSVGQYPLDVDEIGCDFLTATCRKFLRGPRGTGFLFVSDRVLERGYEPLFIDVRGATWVEPERYRRAATAVRFEAWECSYAALIGCAVATRYALRVGLDRIARRTPALGAELRQNLHELESVRVLDRGRELCGIATFTIDGSACDAVKQQLDARGINSSLGSREVALLDFTSKDADWALRLSPHYYNTEAEVELVVGAVAELSGATGT
jgi:selenocysteine lyase/cysteine desulfurase